MRGVDFSPFYRSTVGFDRLFDILDSVSKVDNAAAGYPPYNIERIDEDQYRISLAVAGFGEDDLDIEIRQNLLTVKGALADREGNRVFLHQGIAGRGFERRFQLADHVVVRGAGLENGLLNIELAREIPEEMKPRRIEIKNGGGAKILDGPKAA